MFLVDSHCHLDGLDYESLHKDVDDVLAKAAARDVKFCLAVATTLPGYLHMRDLVGERDNVVFSCGVHPLNQNDPYDVEDLRRLAAEEGVVALGETGLDYYYTPETKVRQQESFIHHIQIGRELNKPVIVHTRDARADTLAILREEKVTDCGGVLHCFTEDRETAGKLLDLGFYISFSGIVTFRNAEQLRDAARYVPLDRLLVETDSPYLAPVPHRGKENQPAMVRDVAEYMAVLKGVAVEELAQATTDNFARLFADNVFWQSLGNNLLYILLTVVPGVTLALLLAVALSENHRVNRWLRTAFFFPMIIPMVSAAALWLFIFMPGLGLLDHYLAKLFGPMNNNWLGRSNSALLALALIGVWKFAGYYMLFFLAGLQSIPASTREAALMEGATRTQVFFKVTLPLLRPTLSFVITTALIYSITQIDHVAVMTRGGPDNATTVLLYYIQNLTWDSHVLGKASAATFLTLAGLFAFSLINLKLLEKGAHYER